jgi:hypothetical protein
MRKEIHVCGAVLRATQRAAQWTECAHRADIGSERCSNLERRRNNHCRTILAKQRIHVLHQGAVEVHTNLVRIIPAFAAAHLSGADADV